MGESLSASDPVEGSGRAQSGVTLRRRVRPVRRSVELTVTFSESEYALIATAAKASGRSPAALVAECGITAARQLPVEVPLRSDEVMHELLETRRSLRSFEQLVRSLGAESDAGADGRAHRETVWAALRSVHRAVRRIDTATAGLAALRHRNG